MSMNRYIRRLPAAVAGLGLLASQALLASPILSNAVATISLDGPASVNSGSIAYHPGFNQYYGGRAGSTGYPGYVWDAAGNRIQTLGSMNVDARAFNYNPNTDAIEVVTFNAVNGGSPAALMTMGLDSSGLYTGSNSTALATMAGLPGSQVMPAYDGGRDRFYARSSSAAVSVVARSDGSLSSSFNLDLAAAGASAGDLVNYFIGFDPVEDVLVALDDTLDRALVFDLSGAYLGASQLPGIDLGSYNAGYANGQVFVLDSQTGAYRGYDIFAGQAVPAPATLALLGLGLAGVGLRRRRRSG